MDLYSNLKRIMTIKTKTLSLKLLDIFAKRTCISIQSEYALKCGTSNAETFLYFWYSACCC